MGDNLRIGIGVEDSSLELQLLFQLFCIDQVAVVGHHHGALDMADHQGLGILPGGDADGGIPHMAHGDLAGAHLFQVIPGEHIRHQAHVLIGGDDPAVVDRDAAALLAPVL